MKQRRVTQSTDDAELLPKSEKPRRILRFTGSAFQYNTRVGLAFLPGVISILLFGGSSVITSIFFALLVGYVFDLFEKTQAVFLVLWCSLSIITLQLFSLGIPLVQLAISNLFTLGLVSLFCLLFACWVSIQFKWLQKSSPQSMVLLERILFGLSPIVISVLLTYTGISLYGVTNAPFMLLLTLSYTLYLMSGPLKSSFRPADQLISDRIDQTVHAISLFMLPLFCHVGMFYQVLFQYHSMMNMMALIDIGILFLHFTKRYDILTTFRISQPEKIANALAVVAGTTLIFFFEYRVIFSTSFYYAIPLPAPFNFLFVTLGLYTGVGLAYAFISGQAKLLGKPICLGIGLTSAFAMGNVMGMTLLYLPFIMGASYFLVQFYFRNKGMDYILFGLLSACVVFWYVLRSYMFLDFSVGGIPIQLVGMFLVLMTIFAIALPANVFAPQRGIIIAVYCGCLFLLESMISFSELEIYPFYMVLFTSVLGYYMTQHLEKLKLIDDKISWFCVSFLVAKIWATAAVSQIDVFASLLATLAVTAPHYLHKKFTTKLFWMYFGMLGVVGFMTAPFISSPVLTTFVENDIVPGGYAVGTFLLTWSLGSLAIIIRFLPNESLPRRLCIGIAILGLSFILVDPEYGVFVSLGGATPWLLIGVLLVSLFCFRSRYAYVRLFYVVSMGFFCSGLILDNALTFDFTLLLTFAINYGLFVCLVNWLYIPSKTTQKYAPLVLGALLVMFVVTLGAGKLVTSAMNPRAALFYMRQVRQTTLGSYTAMLIFLGLLYKLKADSTAEGRSLNAQMGNVCTLIGFALAEFFSEIVLRIEFAPLFLGPIMLLLNKDGFLFRWLNEENRYGAVVGGTVVGLSGKSLFSIGVLLFAGRWKLKLAKELFFLVCCLPSSGILLDSMITGTKRPALWWLILTPLTLIGLFSSFWSTIILGIVGFVGAVGYGLSNFLQSNSKPNTI